MRKQADVRLVSRCEKSERTDQGEKANGSGLGQLVRSPPRQSAFRQYRKVDFN